MANRLTKIYTRTGDRGMTRLGNGDPVAKTSTRVRTCGDLDETNSAIGLVLSAADVPQDVRDALTVVQQDLFDLGAEIALPERRRATDTHVARLERQLDAFNATLPPLKEFVLPGGPPSAAACHLARAVCRRAERTAWELASAADVNPELLKYLNRLSDLLFVIARVLARAADSAEPLWEPGRAID